jgi:hypothetical protein
MRKDLPPNACAAAGTICASPSKRNALSHRSLRIPFPMAFCAKAHVVDRCQVAANGGGGLDEIEPVWIVA